MQGFALSLGNPTLWTITGWRLNDSACRKRLVCDNYSKTEICPLQHFLLYVSFSFFFSVFLFLSCFVIGRHSNPTPAGSHMFYCNWLNCYDKCEGVKTHFSAEPGSYLAASLHTTHTHWCKKQPGFRLSLLWKEKEERKSSRRRANKLKIASLMLPLWKAWQGASGSPTGDVVRRAWLQGAASGEWWDWNEEHGQFTWRPDAERRLPREVQEDPVQKKAHHSDM